MKSQRLEKNDRDGFQAMSVSTEIDSESSEDDTWRRRWRGKVILYTSIAFISAMILVFVNFNTGEKNARAPKVPKNSQHSNMSGGDTHAVSTPSRPEWTGIFSKGTFVLTLSFLFFVVRFFWSLSTTAHSLTLAHFHHPSLFMHRRL